MLTLATLLAACSAKKGDSTQTSDPTTKSSRASSGDPATLEIGKGKRYATIQSAVDAASPGDLLLIYPGTYNESVSVFTNDIVIRGLDRNQVVLDGQDKLGNGIGVFANGVAVENLTVHSYLSNGVVFNGAAATDDGSGDSLVAGVGQRALVGYRVSYVTAYNNGLYGIYAFAARGGLIEHSYVSGHPDSGIYIGQCKPCDAVVTDSVAQKNAIGYLGTNASGNLFVVKSRFEENRVGMSPNSQKMEELAPQMQTVLAGNLVLNNNSPMAPAQAGGGFATGIFLGGGHDDLITANRIVGHLGFGILLGDIAGFEPVDNRIENNQLSENSLDIGFGTLEGKDLLTNGNCFSNNGFSTSVPPAIEKVLPCESPIDPNTPLGQTLRIPQAPPNVDYRKISPPAPQELMPNPKGPAQPVSAEVPIVDVASIQVPEVGA